jgi:hypothetical protein
MKNDGQKGGRQKDVREKGDVRRQEGGPGQEGHRGTTSRSPADENRTARVRTFEKPVMEPMAPAGQPKNEERHANKRQPEESGPGRVSRPPPKEGRFERQ